MAIAHARSPRTDGGAQRCATGLENRADREVVGSTPEPSANFMPRVGARWHTSERG
jgi:hypothetical protein